MPASRALVENGQADPALVLAAFLCTLFWACCRASSSRRARGGHPRAEGRVATQRRAGADLRGPADVPQPRPVPEGRRAEDAIYRGRALFYANADSFKDALAALTLELEPSRRAARDSWRGRAAAGARALRRAGEGARASSSTSGATRWRRRAHGETGSPETVSSPPGVGSDRYENRDVLDPERGGGARGRRRSPRRQT